MMIKKPFIYMALTLILINTNNVRAQDISGLTGLFGILSILDLSGTNGGASAASLPLLDGLPVVGSLMSNGDPITPALDGLVLPLVGDVMGSVLLAAPDQYLSSMTSALTSGDFDPAALIPFLLIAPTSLIYDMNSKTGFIPVIGGLDGVIGILPGL